MGVFVLGFGNLGVLKLSARIQIKEVYLDRFPDPKLVYDLISCFIFFLLLFDFNVCFLCFQSLGGNYLSWQMVRWGWFCRFVSLQRSGLFCYSAEYLVGYFGNYSGMLWILLLLTSKFSAKISMSLISEEWEMTNSILLLLYHYFFNYSREVGSVMLWVLGSLSVTGLSAIIGEV